VQDYLDYHNRIDLTLDTWPYSGTTTTCSALYMGVPVLTVSGRHHVERVTESILTHCGHAEWVCNGAESGEASMPHWDEYVRRAAEWPLPSEEPGQEQARREQLRQQFMTAMDPGAFMRDWEAMIERVVGRQGTPSGASCSSGAGEEPTT
jgi:predicted O-linked N-acetylglucosamine transferase (SPINDLY family)